MKNGIIILGVCLAAITGLLMSKAGTSLAPITHCEANIGDTPEALAKKIDTYLATIADKRFSGAVLVEYRGQIILSKGYGESDREQGIAYTPTTISDIGSVTKQFTAAAILKLEMQGKLSVDDKISKYFANVPEDKSDITIHDLLTMSAGLHTYSDTKGDFEAVTEDGFIKIAMDQKPLSPVGKKWLYSNTSYSLLAILVERVSGKTYEEYLYQNIFQPAGMEHTGYSRLVYPKSNVAVGYVNGENWGRPTEKPWDEDAPYLHLKGNGGLLSTAEDLYKWHRALMRDEVLSAEVKRKYFHPHIETDKVGFTGHYAYGWFVETTTRGTKLIRHAGGNGATFAYLRRFVDDQAAIIVLSNDTDPYNTKVIGQIQGMVFEPCFEPLEKSGYIGLSELSDQGMTADDIIAFIKEEKLKSTQSDYNLSEREINHFAYGLVRLNKLEQAVRMFQFNVESYPNSSNAFDSYGETLLELGRPEEAVAAYRQALSLDSSYNNADFARKTVAENSTK